MADVSADLGFSDRSALTVDNGKNGVVPSFGWHPWFSHMLYDDTAEEPTYNPQGEDDVEDAKTKHYTSVLSPTPDSKFVSCLPPPTSLSSFLSSTRDNLKKYPLALVGEIGIDKGFRLPVPWDDAGLNQRDDALTTGGREGRPLSPHRVDMFHQQAILTAQLKLAGELGRAVSVHGVQAHGVLFDTIKACWKGHEKHVMSRRERRQIAPGAEDWSEEEDDDASKPKPYPPRICLHSFSGSPEQVRGYIHPSVPAKIFFSFSACINLSTEKTQAKLEEVLKVTPDDAVLVESDLHSAGEQMDDVLEEMYRKVCEIKGWDLEDGIKRIGKNYEAFIFG